MTTPQFKVGDVVQHKASGKKAAIYSVDTKCETHDNLFRCLNADDCVRVEIDSYSVHLDFGDPLDIKIPGCMLRLEKSD